VVTTIKRKARDKLPVMPMDRDLPQKFRDIGHVSKRQTAIKKFQLPLSFLHSGKNGLVSYQVQLEICSFL